MDIDLSALHFIRPLWLLLLVPGLLLPIIWRNGQSMQRRLNGKIAPHLLDYLLLTPQDNHRLRPVHLCAAILIIGAIAAAGPTWQEDRPDFVDNHAPLILALDLSPSMDSRDVPPSRLEAAKNKLHDLVERRGNAHTALIAYAGSAHIVLPATDDPALLNSFIEPLSSSLLEMPGKNLLQVVEQAKRILAAEKAPGSLVIISDGADTSQLDALQQQLKGSLLQVLILAVGSEASNFDRPGLEQLAHALDAPLGSLTLNDDDLDWIELHAQKHFKAASGDANETRWKDAGYWLVWPLLLIALLCIRRGWSISWSAAIILGIGLAQPAPAQAGGFADAFLTADQQGRWAFEHGHLPAAAAHFKDPYWKGIAAYQASDYKLAVSTFSTLDTARGQFYLGNSQVRLFQFAPAIEAYKRALALQPDFAEAKANLKLTLALQEKSFEDAENLPGDKADELKFDNTSDRGKETELKAGKAISDELWLQNLSTSPAKFLKQKFSMQNAARTAEGTAQ